MIPWSGRSLLLHSRELRCEEDAAGRQSGRDSEVTNGTEHSRERGSRGSPAFPSCTSIALGSVPSLHCRCLSTGLY